VLLKQRKGLAELYNLFDLPTYCKDRLVLSKVDNVLYWYKKHKGVNWIKGQNFGDYLSLIIVGEIIRRNRIKVSKRKHGKLLAVGSILHFASNGDTIWGAGVNGKIPTSRYNFDSLDVRMVRGPLTKQFLENKEIIVKNSIFGDPALLLPTLFPKLKRKPEIGKITVIPNLNEYYLFKNSVNIKYNLVSPFTYWTRVLEEILSSELVLSSSLHGIIVSEAFGVPVRFVMPCGGETVFKYDDYYKGTGRNLVGVSETFETGIRVEMGLAMPEPIYDPQAILQVFPTDFFNKHERVI
jgi:pyruvyltransferase